VTTTLVHEPFRFLLIADVPFLKRCKMSSAEVESTPPSRASVANEGEAGNAHAMETSNVANISGGNNGQHYSLRWNNHQSHVLSAFEALLQSSSLVDCTLVCEDASIKAHKVVLSACSPYFRKIFVDNPCKHPVIVLKDIRGWEAQCIVDFMYKGETSVPESQLTQLIRAAEGLKVRGLTSGEQQHISMVESGNSPVHNGYSRYSPGQGRASYEDGSSSSSLVPPAKMSRPPPSHSSQSSPMSLTQQDERPRSPGPHASGPRRKQARPRRRSGDSIGAPSLDLSKVDSPPGLHAPPSTAAYRHKSPANANGGTHSGGESDPGAPENLSLKRPSSSPAINLVKTESLLEERERPTSNAADSSTSPLAAAAAAAQAAAALAHGSRPASAAAGEGPPAFHPLDRAAHLAAGNGIHHMGEHEARVEALQVRPEAQKCITDRWLMASFDRRSTSWPRAVACLLSRRTRRRRRPPRPPRACPCLTCLRIPHPPAPSSGTTRIRPPWPPPRPPPPA